MRHKSIASAILISMLVLLLACSSNNPSDSEGKGHLSVTSTPDSASIFLDGSDTGKLTPESFTKQVGEYIIEVAKYGFTSNPRSRTVNLQEGEYDTVSFELTKIQDTSFVFVSSEPESAEIYVEDAPSGYYTPETLAVPFEDGEQKIGVKKQGFQYNYRTVTVGTLLTRANFTLSPRRKIFVEDFTNTGCDPCGMVDPYLKSLKERFKDSLVMVAYHASFPEPTDSFYLANPEGNDNRIDFYGIPNVPQVYINGENILSSVEDTTFLSPDIQDKLIKPTPVAIWGNTSAEGGGVELNLHFSSDTTYSANITVLAVADSVYHPANNGIDVHNHVFHKIISSQTITHEMEDLTVSSSDITDLHKFSFVVFIQDPATERIINCQKF